MAINTHNFTKIFCKSMEVPPHRRLQGLQSFAPPKPQRLSLLANSPVWVQIATTSQKLKKIGQEGVPSTRK
jgi:hypothetical protein